MVKENGWWEQRLGLGSALHKTLDEDIPGGAKFAYALGSATLLTFLTLAITGIWELFFYVPSTAGAYNSVNYIRFEVPFGWLIHGIHFWAANVMVVLVMLHLAQTFFWGAFKKPRELTWVLGTCLFFATLFAMFTGSPLGWDQQGYWAANVGSNLAGSVPVVGGFLQSLVFVTQPLGQLTLSRLFPIHVVIVPVIILGIIALHVVAFRKGGAAGSIKESPKIGKFWPEQVLMDLIVYSGVLALLVWLSANLLTPMTGPADPIDATYVARPEWPFMWLFQSLKYLSGNMEAVGFILIPLVTILLVFAVPWLDRKAERSPLKRPISMVVFVLFVAMLGGLTYLGLTEVPPPVAGPTGPPPPTPDSALSSTPTVVPSVASNTIGSASQGQLIFVAYCQQCHGPEGKKGIENPGSVDGEIPVVNPIDPEISGADKNGKIPDVQTFVSNLDVYLQDGSSPDATPDGGTVKYKMPSFGNTYAMSQQQIANVEAYVVQINGGNVATINKPGVEPKLYAWWAVAGFVLVAVFGGLALVMGRRRKQT